MVGSPDLQQISKALSALDHELIAIEQHAAAEEKEMGFLLQSVLGSPMLQSTIETYFADNRAEQGCPSSLSIPFDVFEQLLCTDEPSQRDGCNQPGSERANINYNDHSKLVVGSAVRLAAIVIGVLLSIHIAESHNK